MGQRKADIDLSHLNPYEGDGLPPSDHPEELSEDVWRLTLENLTDTVLLTEESGDFSFVCPNVHHIFELTADQVLDLENVVHLLDFDPRTSAELQRAGRVEDLRRSVLTPGDEVRQLLIDVKEVEIERARYLFSCRDITRYVREESRHQLISQHMKDLAVSFPGVSWMTDLGFTEIFFVSPDFDEFFGVSGESLRKDPRKFQQIIHPDDRRRFLQTLAVVQEHPEQSPFEVDFRILRSGETRWFRSKLNVVSDREGIPTRVVGYTSEITEKRRAHENLMDSEERFRQLAENIEEVFWLSAVDKETLYVSPAFEDIWGIPAEEIYRDFDVFLEAIHPEDRERVEEAMFRDQVRGEYDEEYRIVRPDGEVRWIHDRAFPVTDEEGEVYRLAGLAEDITEQRKLENELMESVDRQKRLLREVHHRVKNNLQKIIGLIHLQVRDMDPSEEVRSAFRNLKHRIYSMARIHDLVYEESSLDAIDVQAYVTDLAEYVVDSHAPSPLDVTLSVEVDPLDLPVDTLLPCGVVINELLANAIDHAFEDRSAGSIDLSFHEVEEGSYELVVADDGRGWQGEDAPEETQSLGLRLVTNLVREQLDGEIEFSESDEGVRCRMLIREVDL